MVTTQGDHGGVVGQDLVGVGLDRGNDVGRVAVVDEAVAMSKGIPETTMSAPAMSRV
jgi:hypothetical protein